MKTKKNNSAKVYLNVFLSTIRDIDALKEFYLRSNKSLIAYRLELENEYAVGEKNCRLI